MTTETHHSTVKRWCSMAAQSMMKLLQGKPSYDYIAHLRATPTNLSKLMILATGWNASSSIMPTQDDEPNMPKFKVHVLTQCNKSITASTANADHYESPERFDKQSRKSGSQPKYSISYRERPEEREFEKGRKDLKLTSGIFKPFQIL